LETQRAQSAQSAGSIPAHVIMTNLTQTQIDDREILLADCPIIGVYAETGTGKTTFTGSLTHDERYQRTLFIDGDRGQRTMAAVLQNPDLCELIRMERVTNALALQQWLSREIGRADQDPAIKAIVIEGLGRVYEDAVGEAYAAADEKDLKGNGLKRLYIVPSGLTGAIISSVCNLQHRLIAAKRSVPIFVTVTTKTETDDDHEWEIPALSTKRTKQLMARSESFVQLTRKGTTVRVHTDRDARNPFRKLRGEPAARAVANMASPDAPSMLQVWADAEGAERRQVAQYLLEQAQA
jgi:hypothetical protein